MTHVIQILPCNRAALSLLGYCYYYQGHYESASQAFESLVRYHGEFPEYRFYHAQALFKMGELVEAGRVLEVVSGFSDEVAQLKLAIAYSVDQVTECKRLLRSCKAGTVEMLQSEGCILYKEGAHA